MTKQPKNTQAPRVGRPRREEAGDVNARILAAATALFLEKGMAATSCEAVVAKARVGKASLYSRYSGKNELFDAVVRQAVDGGSFPLEGIDVIQAPLRDRLARAGKAVLMQALEPVPLELMRLLLTEARRFPDLVQSIDQMARDKVVDIVAHSIETGRPEKISENENKPSPQDIAERFLDLTFSPILLAALTGQESQTSTDAIDQRIHFALDVLEQLGFLDEKLH